MTYKTYFQTLASLSDSKKEQMAQIYFQYYQGSDKKRFYDDLQGKDEVLFLEYEQQVVGFTTMQIYPFAGNMIVYSGDTIVIPEHWRQQSLHKAWIQRVGQLQKQYPEKKFYWFLLVKGYKTYKYLVLFAKQFHPHWQQKNMDLAGLAAQLAVDKFGNLYQPTKGVVECPSSYGYLKKELVQLTAHEQKKISARFFLQTNPYYYKGYELVCLCELSEDNLNPKFRQLFQEACVEYRNE